MLRKEHVDRAIIQAEYQSGDRYTIASALKLDPRLGVMILHSTNSDATARQLQRLYGDVENADNRVVLVPVPPKEDTARNRRKYRGQDFGRVAVQQHYTNATQPAFIDHIVPKSDRAREKQNFVFDQLDLIEDGIKLERVSAGTYAIGEAFDPMRGPAHLKGLQRGLREFWGLDNVEPVRLWLNGKGFSPNKRYVFLFTKRGARTAEKAHHFTSILTWRLLADKIKAETDIIPVAVGDDIGLNTKPNLVEFWNEQGWKDAFDGAPTRRDQLGLWAYFAAVYGSCSIVGMRSGMIEVPALMGIRTRFIEERGNGQAQRMASWLGRVPGWTRHLVDRTPGMMQQKYMADYRHTRDATTAEAAQAGALSYGMKVSDLGGPMDRDAFKDKLNAVFGDTPMEGETRFDPSQIQMHSEEFDELVRWIKLAPRGGAPRGLPEAREDETRSSALEVAMANMRARVAQRDYSDL